MWMILCPPWEDEQERVGLSDLSAAAGCRSGRLKESAGVIYWSDEEFLAHLDAQPYKQPGL